MTLTPAETREALRLVAEHVAALTIPVSPVRLGRLKHLTAEVAGGDRWALAALRKTAPEVQRSSTAAIPYRYDPDTDTLIPSPRDTPELYPPEAKP